MGNIGVNIALDAVIVELLLSYQAVMAAPPGSVTDTVTDTYLR